jgi:hypothetical protein
MLHAEAAIVNHLVRFCSDRIRCIGFGTALKELTADLQIYLRRFSTDIDLSDRVDDLISLTRSTLQETLLGQTQKGSDFSRTLTRAAVRQQWRQRVIEQEQSGQSVRVYCLQRTLEVDMFQLWRRRLQREDGNGNVNFSPLGEGKLVKAKAAGAR